MSFWNLFNKPKPKLETPYGLKVPETPEPLSLMEWKANPNLVSWAAKQLSNPLFRAWFNMIRNEMPLIYPGGNVTGLSQVAVNIVPGYQRCIEVMVDSAKYQPMQVAQEPPMEYPNPLEEGEK